MEADWDRRLFCELKGQGRPPVRPAQPLWLCRAPGGAGLVGGCCTGHGGDGNGADRDRWFSYELCGQGQTVLGPGWASYETHTITKVVLSSDVGCYGQAT